VFTFRRAADALARTLLPEAGARVPDAGDARWAAVSALAGQASALAGQASALAGQAARAPQGEAWVLVAQTGALSAPPTEDALRAREAAMLLRDADDALVGGDLDEARAKAVEALEHAPRHPEIVRRILDVDARAGGRAEAALAMLVELRGSGEDNARFGTTPGELLAETGDTEAALASLERAGQTEEAPALSARAYEIAADLARDPLDAGAWLDRAIARAPRSVSARWARVGRRLELGRLEDALADVEHLEAMGRGNRARYAVWLRAGRAWDAAGLSARAGALYERALRYAPEEPEALAGLGAALVKDGAARERARGIAVLTRACEIADSRGASSSRLLLHLGRALATALEDLPAAISRVSGIPIEAPEAAEARGLEGRWRARLGDLAGAALAFARLRDVAASIPPPQTPAEHRRGEAIAAMLAEAAEMERTRMHDPLAAQRYLGAALRLRPQDPSLRHAYREVGALVAGRSVEPEMDRGAASEFPEIEEASATHHRPITEGPALPKLDLSLASDDDAEGAARVEELTRRLQGNPADDAVADELLALLESLGRGHELLALVSARLEDATPERRANLAPRARAALERMAVAADAAGRTLDATLFRDATVALGLNE
jgi:tetratricopeptide (TPR) repeat protein